MTLKGIYAQVRNSKPNVLWIYGPTGRGKTRWVHDNYKDIYIKGAGKWWDGYDANDCCLIDDYRRDFMKFHELLRFTDRYGFPIEYKGGSSQFNSPNIIFTSPRSPLEMWEGRTDEDIAQLTRRISRIVHIDDLLIE